MTKQSDEARARATMDRLSKLEMESVLSKAQEVLWVDATLGFITVTPCGVRNLTRAYGLTHIKSDDQENLQKVTLEGVLTTPESEQADMQMSMFSFHLTGTGPNDLDGGLLFSFIASSYKDYISKLFGG